MLASAPRWPPVSSRIIGAGVRGSATFPVRQAASTFVAVIVCFRMSIVRHTWGAVSAMWSKGGDHLLAKASGDTVPGSGELRRTNRVACVQRSWNYCSRFLWKM